MTKMPPSSAPIALAAFAVVAVLLAACGDDKPLPLSQLPPFKTDRPDLVQLDNPPQGYPKRHIVRDESGECADIEESWQVTGSYYGHPIWVKRTHTDEPVPCPRQGVPDR